MTYESHIHNIYQCLQHIFVIYNRVDVDTLPETNIAPKIKAWKINFLLGQKAYFQGLWLLVLGMVLGGSSQLVSN